MISVIHVSQRPTTESQLLAIRITSFLQSNLITGILRQQRTYNPALLCEGQCSWAIYISVPRLCGHQPIIVPRKSQQYINFSVGIVTDHLPLSKESGLQNYSHAVTST